MATIISNIDLPENCFNCSTKIDPENRRCNIDGHIFEETFAKCTCERDEQCPLFSIEDIYKDINGLPCYLACHDNNDADEYISKTKLMSIIDKYMKKEKKMNILINVTEDIYDRVKYGSFDVRDKDIIIQAFAEGTPTKKFQEMLRTFQKKMWENHEEVCGNDMIEINSAENILENLLYEFGCWSDEEE